MQIHGVLEPERIMSERIQHGWSLAKGCAAASVVFTTISLCLAATVTGTVRRSGTPNDPVINARVTIFDPSLSYFGETRTDSLGAYSILNVPSGSYRIGCAALGREYVEQAITVVSGSLQRDFSVGPEAQLGVWTVIGDTSPEVLDATDIATLLPDGRIFYCHDTQDPILFDPVTGGKTFPSGSGLPSGCMNGSLLTDGTVIFAGGQNGEQPGDFVNAVPWVKNFTPLTNTWVRLADLQHAPGRWYPGMTRLSDGSLLVMGGGQCCDAARTNTAERFNLATRTWTYTGSMINPAEFPPSALLYTGEVLITWSPPQLYSPTTGQWRLTGNFNQSDRGWPNHSDHSIIVLSDGRVLAIGVRKGTTTNSSMTELYDPSTGAWTLRSNPGLVRFQSEVVQLPDGHVLVAAGETEVPSPPVPATLGIVKWTDLYDPLADSWRRVADLNQFREYHAVTLLVPDGRVLTTGGTRIKFQVGPTSSDIEAFSPPYLFRGVRPEITSTSASQFVRGSQITFTVSPTTGITSAVLMGIQSTTHWVDAGVPRRLVLPVTQNGAQVATGLPTDPNVLPLGFYMLFAMVDDIPSKGVVVQIVDPASLAGAGRVPDGGEVPGVPLTIEKGLGAHLTLRWGTSCSSGDSDYEIYEGSIGNFTSHVPLLCSTGGSIQATLTPGADNRYYLVVPRNAAREGSYGTTGFGQERTPSSAACLARLVAGCP